MQRRISEKQGGLGLRIPLLSGLVSLLAILGVCVACGGTSAKTTGFVVHMVTAAQFPVIDCNEWDVHVTALANHRFNLNENMSLDGSELVIRLDDILKDRVEKVVFVHGERDLFYEDFIRMLDIIHQRDVTLAITTPQISTWDACLFVHGTAAKSSWVPDSLIPDGLK
jgi:biopolymer transport protein ExbD